MIKIPVSRLLGLTFFGLLYPLCFQITHIFGIGSEKGTPKHLHCTTHHLPDTCTSTCSCSFVLSESILVRGRRLCSANIHSRGARCMLLVSPWLLGTPNVPAQMHCWYHCTNSHCNKRVPWGDRPCLVWTLSHSLSRLSSRNTVRFVGSRESSSHFESCQHHSCIYFFFT